MLTQSRVRKDTCDCLDQVFPARMMRNVGILPQMYTPTNVDPLDIKPAQ